MVCRSEFGSEDVPDVGRAAATGEKDEWASRAAEVQHLQLHVLLHRDKLHRVGRGVLPLRGRSRAIPGHGNRFGLSQRALDRIPISVDLAFECAKAAQSKFHVCALRSDRFNLDKGAPILKTAAERMKFPAPATFGGFFDGQSESHLLLVLIECCLPVAADVLCPEGGSKKHDACREPRLSGSHLVPPTSRATYYFMCSTAEW